jgi:hypothetical protein
MHHFVDLRGRAAGRDIPNLLNSAEIDMELIGGTRLAAGDTRQRRM